MCVNIGPFNDFAVRDIWWGTAKTTCKARKNITKTSLSAFALDLHPIREEIILTTLPIILLPVNDLKAAHMTTIILIVQSFTNSLFIFLFCAHRPK